MPTETLDTAETVKKPEYSHKSFELVFSNFCTKYTERIQSLAGNQPGGGFLGLPRNASVQQMGQRLNEVAAAIGEPPELGKEYLEGAELKEAVLLTSRYLAWNAVMGNLTQLYADKLKDFIKREKHNKASNGGSRHNLGRLAHERDAAVSVLLAQNHALRDFFDSGLAHTLGNDSPERMNRLLSNVPNLGEGHRKGLVKGISLEIASKRHISFLSKAHSTREISVAYGSDNEDARGGDIVLMSGEDILFIDLKSNMPEVFSDGDYSTPDDYARGYKWLEDEGNEQKVVVWAYLDEPIYSEKFSLADSRLSQNLDLIVGVIQA